MKSWFTKFGLFSALDDRKLDETLKSQLPNPEASTSLHPFIMTAVRAAARRPVAEHQFLWPRWIPASALAAMVALGTFLAFHVSRSSSTRIQAADSPSLAAARSALDLGGKLMQSAPAVVMSPLSDEMQSLNRDLANTKEFLAASLP
ncbi:MAG: hypothetical protein JWR69_2350 [Pedosphaera sp.]|nr:hypothetical protein [Pedosphaera sp.]